MHSRSSAWERAATIAGYELLVRLRNAAGELVAPDKFLEACGQYGLASGAGSLGALCRSRSVAAACGVVRERAVVFRDQRFGAIATKPQVRVVRVGDARRRGVAGRDCSASSSRSPQPSLDLAAADALIRELTNAGAKVALDNFGSGLSSIAHLKQLPVSYLKIDGAFVRRIGADRIAESIVSGIARAARMLGVATIAEHVETAAVAERLRDLDVTLAQGFHFAPSPAVRRNRRASLALRQRRRKPRRALSSTASHSQAAASLL